jgi:uncharacterized protein (TIGR03086 family)
MSENLRMYTKAVYGFDHVMRTVPEGTWDRPSPCEGWTALDVAGHAMGVVAMIRAFAEGTAPQHHDGPPRDITGADPHATWAELRDGVLEALDHQGVLQRVVPSPFGPMPLDTLIGTLLVDTLVHSWDLARATGADERLDPGLVERAHGVLAQLGDGIRGPGMFDPVVTTSDAASAQDRFIAFTGRRV